MKILALKISLNKPGGDSLAPKYYPDGRHQSGNIVLYQSQYARGAEHVTKHNRHNLQKALCKTASNACKRTGYQRALSA